MAVRKPGPPESVSEFKFSPAAISELVSEFKVVKKITHKCGQLCVGVQSLGPPPVPPRR